MIRIKFQGKEYFIKICTGTFISPLTCLTLWTESGVMQVYHAPIHLRALGFKDMTRLLYVKKLN